MGQVIVGLGNTGGEYERTRHNAGRDAVIAFHKDTSLPPFAYKKNADALVTSGEVNGERVTLVLPETLMNRSGKSVATLVKSVAGAKKLLVVQDELDLPLGVTKMVFGKNSGGHKGVESIMRAIKTKNFARLRIGISGAGKKHQAKKPRGEEKVIKHVISKFTPTEQTAMKKVMKKTTQVIHTYLTEGIDQATMVANTRS